MNIQRDYDLTHLNTFGVSVRTKFLTEVKNEAEIKELFSSTEFQNNEKIFLGGGSNVLFTRNFEGLVVLNKLKGIKILEENNENVLIRAMGGEIWHDFVTFSVERGYWGIENLSLIPGTVGAAPMQNIGAYGAELRNVLENVEAYSIEDGEKRIFTKEECKLGYRDSIFKNSLKGKFFISAVVFRLGKIEKKNITYRILQEYLSKNNIEVKNSKDISDSVASIRRSKLPDPKLIGNAGSFFKNVFLKNEEVGPFLEKYPDAPYFQEDGFVKIPAGWLIEHTGPKNGTSWKGYRIGAVGVHDKQALVLVNYGGGKGKEIIDLANKIIESVWEKFRLKLIPEVNIV